MLWPLNLVLERDDRLSDAEFFDFCQLNPKLRIERDETGQIFFDMPTGTVQTHNCVSSVRNADLIAEVVIWNRRKKTGVVTDSNGGFTLPDTSVRAPDVAWTSNERLAMITDNELKKFAPVCPDFVIELLSESDNLPPLLKKMEKYLENGVRLAWLIDAVKQETTVYRPDAPTQTVPFTNELSGYDVLPEFVVTLSELI
jgi:Uma2 family endonuclease